VGGTARLLDDDLLHSPLPRHIICASNHNACCLSGVIISIAVQGAPQPRGETVMP
jgi:hypothetical protein